MTTNEGPTAVGAAAPRDAEDLAVLVSHEDEFGEAEWDCTHGRAAHTANGCLHCACRVTYDGPLASAQPTPGAARQPEPER